MTETRPPEPVAASGPMPAPGAARLGLHERTPPREDLEAVAAVLRSGWLTMGPRTLELESACAQRFGVAHAVACAGDAAALHLALLAVGVGKGDAVVVPGVAGATAARVARRCGAEVVAADVGGPEDPTLDPGDALARAGERTRAIVAVHPAGAPARTGELAAACAARGVALVEHAPSGPSHAPRGDVACHGLLPAGDGDGDGAAVAVVLTRDAALAAFARSRRSHAMTSGTWARHTGRTDSYDVDGLGFNYRVDELRSVLASGRLARADAAAAHRAALASAYRDGLTRVPGVRTAGDAEADADRHAFAVALEDPDRRASLRAALAADRIDTLVPEPVAGAPAHAAAVAAALLWLPLHAGVSADDAGRVVRVLARGLGG